MKKLIPTLTLLLLSLTVNAQIYSFPVSVKVNDEIMDLGTISINPQTRQWKWSFMFGDWEPYYAVDVLTDQITFSLEKGKEPPTGPQISELIINRTPITDFLLIQENLVDYVIVNCINNKDVYMSSPRTKATDDTFQKLRKSLGQTKDKTRGKTTSPSSAQQNTSKAQPPKTSTPKVNSSSQSSAASLVRKLSLSCPDENHPHMIDLGLPSGTKWACCNVGADKPEGYGNLYAWGETQTKTDYSESTSKYYGKSKGGICGTSDDVARVKWGTPWRLPTVDELRELRKECNYSTKSINGVEGLKFIGKNGNSIFLPFAGLQQATTLENQGNSGVFWSGTPYDKDNYDAFSLGVASGFFVLCSHAHRFYGRSVRPVSK